MSVAYSSFNSPYYKWLVDLGYPELDIHVWPDGEWAILEMHNAPVIPSMTKWQYVMTGLKNIEINRSNIRRLVHSIDLKKMEIWDRELKKSQAVEQEHEAVQKHREETALKMAQAYTRNPALMERVAKNGASELDPRRILRHIPKYRF